MFYGKIQENEYELQNKLDEESFVMVQGFLKESVQSAVYSAIFANFIYYDEIDECLKVQNVSTKLDSYKKNISDVMMFLASKGIDKYILYIREEESRRLFDNSAFKKQIWIKEGDFKNPSELSEKIVAMFFKCKSFENLIAIIEEKKKENKA